MTGRCYICGRNGTLHGVERVSDQKVFWLCGPCGVVEDRRRRESGGEASTLLTAANAFPGVDEGS